MKIVIDSNRIIAALLKDHTTRSILFNNKFKFYAPSFIKSEIYKYKNDILTKSKLDKKEFSLLLDLIFSKVIIIPYKEYNQYLQELNSSISDFKDIPYLSVCKKFNAVGIWTHDPHFKGQNIIRILTNIDMLEFIKES